MPRLLHLNASPRPASYSLKLAKAFLDAFRQSHPECGVEDVDLFTAKLPPFEAPEAAAKYVILGGQEPTGPAALAWKPVIDVINRFKSADMYLLNTPMWNFNIPYRLKQYIDILVQPSLTFSYSPQEGYKGLVTGKPLVLALARGGAYGSAPNLDMQKSYLELIFGFIGFTDIRTVVVEPTLSGQEAVDKALREAQVKAAEVARSLPSLAKVG